MKKILFPILLLVLVCTACQKKNFYSEIKPVSHEVWATNKPLTFTVDVKDSSQFFNMYFNVRNTVDFETQNLYVFMKTQFPDGHCEQDTLGFILCDKFGEWTGKGQGRIKDNKFLFQPKMRFPRSGKYKFTVTQAMRTDKLKGISDFGITLENFKEPKKKEMN